MCSSPFPTLPWIIWLDVNTTASASSFLAKLDPVQAFTQAADCVEYIHSHPNHSIFLVVSGSLAKQVVPQVFDCPNLVQIFLFCASIASHTDWGVDFCSKLMMFDHEDDLLTRLWTDIEQHLREQARQYMIQADDFKLRANHFKQPACG